MTPVAPISPAEALLRLRGKGIFPTGLSSAELARLPAELLERSFFSSRTLLGDVLDTYQTRLGQMLEVKQIKRADRVTPENPEGWVSVAPDAGSVRLEIQDLLKSNGYSPDPAKAGTIEDLGSAQRINLVLQMNSDEALAYGHHLQNADPDFADAFPCQELVRFEERKEPRDWQTLWRSAASEVGDPDAVKALPRMIARKDSPIWSAISAFNRPWPPFDYGSGMGLEDVTREEAMAFGILGRDDQVQPPRRAFNEGLTA